MKIAFLFLTRDNINFPDLWLNWFRGHENKYNIYCHPKTPESVTIDWQRKHIINNIVETGWGYIVDAYSELLKVAMQNKDNIKFITISESCVPLQSFDSFYKFLERDHVNTSYINYMRISRYDMEERIKTQENYDSLEIQYKKHYARFCLSRYHCKMLLKQQDKLQFFKTMHVGDEFFLSLLGDAK